MARAITRHEQGDAVVIPVILRSVQWQTAPFGILQSLPRNAKPATHRSWHGLDNAFLI